MDHTVAQLQLVREVYPDLAIETADLRTTRGQFNDVLLVDGSLVFRFPRSPRAATVLQTEAALLRALQGRLPLATPDPIYVGVDPQSHQLTFMGYRLIPGQHLLAATLSTIQDPATLQRLAGQLAGFLHALHHIPVDDLEMILPVNDGRDAWEQMYARLETEVFGSIRPDARDAVARSFEAFLADLTHFRYSPVLRHGDFGGSNILYDAATREVCGVIDFGSAGLGDPAVDLAALSWYGEAFLSRVYLVYPELAVPAVQERARFYRGTRALQQALWALETGDEAEFADGIAAYI
jgi:aminoglycoside 2''-phosphotransferase